MKSKSIIIVISFFLLFIHSLKSQSLSKIWYCSKSNLCFGIDSTSKCIRINENNGIDDCSRSRYERKGDMLIVKMYNNQTVFGWQKDKTEFRIDKLTNDSLYLTLIKSKDLALLETLNVNVKGQLVFFFKPGGCSKN